MNKSELKKNIIKINRLLRSDEYAVGIELIRGYNEDELNKGVAKTIITVLKKRFEKAINIGTRDFDIIDTDISLAIEFSNIIKQKDVFDFLLIDTMKNLKYKDALKNYKFNKADPMDPDPFINPPHHNKGVSPKQPYYDYIVWNLIGYLTPKTLIKECKILRYYKGWNTYLIEKFPEGLCNIHSLERLVIVGGSSSSSTSKLKGWNFKIPDTISNLQNLKEFNSNFYKCNKIEIQRIQELLPDTNLNHIDERGGVIKNL